MDIRIPKCQRRSTRLRVDISLTITSLDRKHPLAAMCSALVVSPQGCGIQSPQALPLETPILLSDLPNGESAAGRVASVRPLGTTSNNFLIGIALYNHGNVWGIAHPPEDWDCPAAPVKGVKKVGAAVGKQTEWPYNLVAKK